MKIIQEIERGKSKSDVARELGLASSTVATIWKNRESIAESWRNRDMMQQADVDDAVPSKKPPSISSLAMSAASTTALCTPAAMTTLTTTTTTTITATPPSAVSGVVVTPPQVQVVPPVLPPPPPPYPTLTLPSAGLAPSTQPTAPISSSSNPSSTTTSTGTTTTTMPPDNTQQAQTQTQSQELLEVRCRMDASWILSTSSSRSSWYDPLNLVKSESLFPSLDSLTYDISLESFDISRHKYVT